MESLQRFRDMGYTDEEINTAIREIEAEESGNTSALQQSYQRTLNNSPMTSSNTLVASRMNEDNLIKWQLELDSILERVEHILRGDKPTVRDGNLIFVPPANDEDKILNDYGVSEIMRVLTMYLNRNTILSNYDEETINWKVLDFGFELSDLIFLKYEEMGLNNLEKRKRYPMIVREIVDAVHSSLLRALNGGERASIRTAMQIHQSESIPPSYGFNSQGYLPRERSVLNPMRYLRGKHYG